MESLKFDKDLYHFCSKGDGSSGNVTSSGRKNLTKEAEVSPRWQKSHQSDPKRDEKMGIQL